MQPITELTQSFTEKTFNDIINYIYRNHIVEALESPKITNSKATATYLIDNVVTDLEIPVKTIINKLKKYEAEFNKTLKTLPDTKEVFIYGIGFKSSAKLLMFKNTSVQKQITDSKQTYNRILNHYINSLLQQEDGSLAISESVWKQTKQETDTLLHTIHKPLIQFFTKNNLQDLFRLQPTVDNSKTEAHTILSEPFYPNRSVKTLRAIVARPIVTRIIKEKDRYYSSKEVKSAEVALVPTHYQLEVQTVTTDRSSLELPKQDDIVVLSSNQLSYTQLPQFLPHIPSTTIRIPFEDV